MERKQVYKEVEEIFGAVPSFIKTLPDQTIGSEWDLFKKLQIDDGPIPQKYRELIGLGIAAVTKCRYCAYYHTAAAKLFGATDEEIQFAVHYAKSSAGWSAYLNGLQMPFEEFKQEIDKAVEFARSQTPQTEMI
ncbi:MAG: carboxymuconolactone decarboxylase family protein [Bacteroidota bacterium]|jgi:AhpD family alkylhydroperoxidase|nr:carboxymuconolactone decarboxylase family protein [Ignavibacteria bacterium]HEX2960468.1 carboxymuconolactone decarboxylase family protein [Ignavibacteriales bacterium]MCU7497902.1 carboxymuconolactone decarboxylase family protein [Ignavibacteria bacterium]MCU7511183.1 carboxymuconolactone decarboxylase family protein [Ignavibacteria bacterium]MCU7518729.1 carboxymuconolactone decarboxylase family protein [Ignavibacteria bacterium]